MIIRDDANVSTDVLSVHVISFEVDLGGSKVDERNRCADEQGGMIDQGDGPESREDNDRSGELVVVTEDGAGERTHEGDGRDVEEKREGLGEATIVFRSPVTTVKKRVQEDEDKTRKEHRKREDIRKNSGDRR